MRWICARLELHRERVAQRFLELGGYAVYIPYVREHVIRRRRRRIERVAPLFPAYGFVQLAETQGWSAVLMGGDSPAAVPDTVLAEIKAREKRGLVELSKPPRFRRGEAVRILAGPFANHLAIFADMNGHERVGVLLRFLGGAHRVTLPKNHIEAVDGL
jgi:transcriptional antiterminator RfaH